MSKRQIGTRWCYTLNNYSLEEAVAVLEMQSSYHICGKEVGDEGTPHLQGYIIFKSVKALSGVKKLQSRAHWEQAKGTTTQNVTYCSKGGLFSETGTRPKTSKEVGELQKEQWADVVRSVREGTCEHEYPKEFIQYNATINRLYQPQVHEIQVYTGIWFYGPPGTGKSRKARDDFPGAYDKLMNKWWDGYVDEESVIIDDIDTTHVHMGLFLKRYADHYPFRAEYKGGSKLIRPKHIIVTSNYSIEDIFGTGTEMTKAIQRRYKVTQFKSLIAK
uniref:ATP-dependent helicase Rep n=1 Tax=Antarctic circular DNA molecule TaxID=2664238 RepID=A0A5Q2F090_9ZZZZ|nr:replication associated protein [Antarctic circular DNA molecule]